jgi:hypothetical protein
MAAAMSLVTCSMRGMPTLYVGGALDQRHR